LVICVIDISVLNCIQVYTWLPAVSPVPSQYPLEPSRGLSPFPSPSLPQGCRYRLAVLRVKVSGRCPGRVFLLHALLGFRDSSAYDHSENIVLRRGQPERAKRNPEKSYTAVKPRRSRVWWNTNFRFGLITQNTFWSS
jgi:hypothetical protein